MSGTTAGMIWVGGAAIGILGLIVVNAWRGEMVTVDGDEVAPFAFAVMWPILLGVVMIAAPFVGLYKGVGWLGRQHRARRAVAVRARQNTSPVADPYLAAARQEVERLAPSGAVYGVEERE